MQCRGSLGGIGPKAEHLLELGDGFVQASQIDQCGAQVEMRGNVIRFQAQGLAKLIGAIGESFLRGICGAKIEVRRGILRLEPHRLRELTGRQIGAPGEPVETAEAVMIVGIAGPARFRRLQMRKRFVELPLLGEDYAQAFLCVRVLPIQFYGAAILSRCRVKLSTLAQDRAEVDMRFGKIGPQTQNFLDLREGLIRAILAQKRLA